ncbi:adaptin ear-binding coat-associated protein 1 [Lentinula edodes]|uniref:Adaptin ear-binding coat-associated protein 1 NECAP-1 n=1 Tax=Lentinula lateritia TaxID=40482 RepID=A0A9W8ZYW5_9AGAR|nr:adaptin ear-binding coat-associated protein 1 [Lentinula edodes]KAJ4469052.1 adaptin ear-binding coat-associated protein 1 NECAP-1 [Lentinula edodes]
MNSGFEDDIESVLHIAREVSVFKIPPLKANEGHRAGEWGDLAQPLWKGRLRILEKNSGVTILFEDGTTGELFAKADYDPSKPCVEAVLDSSRYFVVRIEDNGRKAYIGMGFIERTDSFDFSVALQDYTKRWRASQNPSEPSENEDKPSPHIPAGPKKDFSLKEGQTFSIAIPGKKKAANETSTDLLSTSSASSVSGASGGGFPLLPPPPSSGARRR